MLVGNESDTSDDELSPPDTPVPYLSRNKPNTVKKTSLSTITSSKPISLSSIPAIGTTTPPISITEKPSTSNPLTVNAIGID